MTSKIKIIYEDEWLLVVNKPAGMVVNKAETVKGETVFDWSEKYLGIGKVETDDSEDEVFFKKRKGVAHRLDKETSGCLLIGKTAEVMIDLMRQFREREIKKEYLALVHGKLEPREGVMRLPVGRKRWERQKWEVSLNGKQAETAWEVMKYCEGGKYSLVKLRPKTGRTHQIRVHMKHLGFPLFGDEKYLPKKKVKADREVLNRHFLHAESIEFEHPKIKKRMKVRAKLPNKMKRVLMILCDIDYK